ncbi:flagellin/flagellar hook associated protein [Desulfocapsa sulfexigens DSM 10523]|uniref:Flagellin/flagellar hook associated protein n=1 Tax=Desulfocapsa sulfexigens (strain DSM 10523 / SB164P1) TaxID=1167006 RepID=M1PTH2_DESSD|nr:flagellin/flagellar hook associated protein [Desulfocapsa sulfexigens]AGF79636.1 flagellin/flagellar hook associated protein [Desulfocapsa sulfexigens DSM 10523]
MKATEGTTYRMLQSNLGRITTKLEDLRIQGATGTKVNQPSDDPSSIRPVLTTRTQIMHTDRYLETMGVTLDKMEATDGHLNHVENILQRVKEISVNSINGAMSQNDLDTFADEIANLKAELVDAANAQVDGKFIFAGYAENTIPFVENPNYNPNPPVDPLNLNPPYDAADSTTWPYLYMGTPNPTELEITPGERLQANLTGNDLFFGINNTTMLAGGPSPPAVYASDSGRIDIFSVLTRTEEALRAGNIDDPLGAGGGLVQNLENVDIAADQNRRLRSQLGNRARRVDSAMLHQTDVQIDLQQVLSRYLDADAIETFNAIVQQETAFQAALSITSKVSQISILDYF